MTTVDYQDVAGQLPGHARVIADHLRRNGFESDQAVNRQVLGLAEEVGEFVGAYRRWSGQARRSGTAEEMYAELADVIIAAFVTAHELRVDIDAVLAAKLHTVYTRGWRESARAIGDPTEHRVACPCGATPMIDCARPPHGGWEA